MLQVAPATGTPETGGWSTRELRTIIRGLEGINLIAADLVEVRLAHLYEELSDTNIRRLRLPMTQTQSILRWLRPIPCMRL
jgi:arginase family enzyme